MRPKKQRTMKIRQGLNFEVSSSFNNSSNFIGIIAKVFKARESIL